MNSGWDAMLMFTEDEPMILIMPPSVLVQQKVVPRDTWYIPIKAVYGLRRSPRAWGLCRDKTILDFRIIAVKFQTKVLLRLVPLQSEPNLWKITVVDEEDEDEEKEVVALMMTYVDDICIVGEGWARDAVVKTLRSAWTTTDPEEISTVPVRFLGMELTKKTEEDEREAWFLTQSAYLKDLILKDDDIAEKKIPISKDLSILEPDDQPPGAEDIRKNQKLVGELLRVVTRTRPDLMYGVSRTKVSGKLQDLGRQMKGYLKATLNHGLKMKAEKEEFVELRVFADASYGPDGQESHGAFVVMLGSSPMFWRSGKQAMVTLSTAEAELLEIIQGMVAGEAVAVVVQELFEKVTKTLWSDAQSAIAILGAEGGSWRTRRLKLRAGYARQAVVSGEWRIAHMLGEKMIADLGAKPLSSTRLEMLKQEMGMVEGQDDQSRRKEGEEDEVKIRNEVKEMNQLPEKAKEALKLITMAALISAAEGRTEVEIGEFIETQNVTMNIVYEGWTPFEVAAALVITAVALMITVLVWKMGVRLASNFFRTEQRVEARSPSEPAAGGQRGEHSRSGVGQILEKSDPILPDARPSSSLTSRPDELRFRMTTQNVEKDSRYTRGGVGQMASASAPNLPDAGRSSVLEQSSDDRHRQDQPETKDLAETMSPGIPLNFEVYRARFGKVYRLSRKCRVLEARQSGPLGWRSGVKSVKERIRESESKWSPG